MFKEKSRPRTCIRAHNLATTRMCIAEIRAVKMTTAARILHWA